jgi:hypothetical protein
VCAAVRHVGEGDRRSIARRRAVITDRGWSFFSATSVIARTTFVTALMEKLDHTGFVSKDPFYMRIVLLITFGVCVG